MPYRVIRAVQRLSAAHARGVDLWTGRTTVGELVDTSVWTKEHFPKFLALITLTAGCAGNSFMGHLRRSDIEYKRRKREQEQLEARQVVPAFPHALHSFE